MVTLAISAIPPPCPAWTAAKWLGAVVVLSAPLALSVGQAGGAQAHETKAGQLKIVHPYVKEPPPGVTEAVVSMTIRNSGSRPDTLLAATSPRAASAVIVAPPAAAGGTVAQGAPAQDRIDIPAGGSVKLAPAGPLIRLTGLTKPLTSYDTLPLSLTFARAGRIEVEVMVEEGDGPPAAAPAR